MSVLVIGALIATLVGGTGVGLGVVADGSVPGEPLHELDTAIEAARMLLTFDKEAKAELALKLAEERLAELEELLKGDYSEEDIQAAIEEYERYVELAGDLLEELGVEGESIEELKALHEQFLTEHIALLVELRESAPEVISEYLYEAIATVVYALVEVEVDLEAVLPQEVLDQIVCLPEGYPFQANKPVCAEGQLPIAPELPEEVWCVPEGYPFETELPTCAEGQLPIAAPELPEEVICVPEGYPFETELRTCAEGELPIAPPELPEEVTCVPEGYPFETELPTCAEGQLPVAAPELPEEVTCVPEGYPFESELPTCAEDELPVEIPETIEIPDGPVIEIPELIPGN